LRCAGRCDAPPARRRSTPREPPRWIGEKAGRMSNRISSIALGFVVGFVASRLIDAVGGPWIVGALLGVVVAVVHHERRRSVSRPGVGTRARRRARRHQRRRAGDAGDANADPYRDPSNGSG
jgi:hypothetical protein